MIRFNVNDTPVKLSQVENQSVNMVAYSEQPVRMSAITSTSALMVVSTKRPPSMTVQDAVVVHGTGTEFDGPYEVTPKVNAQVLPTKHKHMTEDLTVLSIPYYEADNNKGTTIFIASEV